jgi:hypothetical protein
MMPYLSRLYWCGGKGYARLDGDEPVRLTAAPQCLDGIVVDAIDYVPGGVGMVMARYCGWTDMDGEQRTACEHYLRQLFGKERRS